MFKTFAYSGIEAVQTAQKQWVSTFIQHEQIKQSLNDLVDTQTSYTKSVIDAGTSVFGDTVSILADRTPYIKLAKQIQSYFPEVKGVK